MTVLAVSDLSKSYGATAAVDRLSFEVARGEIVGLLGPNGAGKTTTINMILGVLEPTRRHDSHRRPRPRDAIAPQALARTNFAAVYAPLPGNLTVQQNLRFFGMIYGVRDLAARIDALLEQFDLVRFRDTKCGVLSSGEQTRVALAKAMLNRPRLLLLDEPTASLDPSTAQRHPRDAFAHFVAAGQAACCGPRTTCTRWRRSATACCSCRTGADPARRRPEDAAARARQGDAGGAVHRRGARAARARDGDLMQPSPRRLRSSLRQFYLIRGSLVAGAAAVRLGGDRHRAVGVHHPIPEHRGVAGLQLRAGAPRARCCCGTSSPA